VLPNLNSPQQQQQQQQQGPKGRRAKGSVLRPDVSPDPLQRLATSPQTPSMMDKARSIMAGKSPKVATPLSRAAAAGAAGPGVAAGGLKAAASAALPASPAQQWQAQGAAAQGTQQQQQQQAQQPPEQSRDVQQQQEQMQPEAGRARGLKLLLSHSHSCSFSNLPRGLQQLLNSGDGSRKRRKSRHKHKHMPPVQQQAGASTAPQPAGNLTGQSPLQPGSRVDSLVFGDIDGSVYRRLSSEQGASKAVTKPTRTAPGAGGDPGAEEFRSCTSEDASSASDTSSSSSSSEDSDSDSSASSSRCASGAGPSGRHLLTSSEGTSDASPDDEGPSLRSQLLLGHLLLLASNAVGAGAAATAADGSSSTVGSTQTAAEAAVGLSGLGSAAMQPAGLQLLAGHLRRSGLLPKWVHWLLRQLPQRPELYERAFQRLFQQVCMVRWWWWCPEA